VADLPTFRFNNWRDPQGYHLDDSRRLVIRNGSRKDNWEPLEPLKNKSLYSAFANEVASVEGLLKFVQRHGPLTEEGHYQGDDVRHVLRNADRMRYLLKIRSVQRKKRGQAKTLALEFPFTPLHVGVDWERTTFALRWVFRPLTLLDGLWVQFGQAITGGAFLQTCGLCRDWFPVGYPSDRRLDSKFCCDEHRVQYNSLKRSKGE
jgi:hypothetical protein